ncbi:ParA family protein, partial [Vibrio parahaemolyticus]|nr:ParA family protein [Vibrio parahaemolyticus]
MKNVVIANSKGGSGKTTISLNLIQHLKPSYIIDADAHLGISNLMRLTETPTAVKVPKSKKDIVTWMKADKGLLVDCGGFDSDLTRAAIGEADVIITPTNDDPTEQFALMKFNDVLKVISKQKGKEVKAQVLLNRVHPSRREFNA